ncbi:hypothetical protein H4R99_008404 [Coemansia sp. RSA 1722]|nr:hypothetical protein H4R99_008404 [Coemansia sp. RSA 1722]
MPGRPKRMRYTFVNQTRSAQQPVYAWKKAWASPKSAGIDDISSGQTIVHEDDEDDNVNQQQQQQQQQQQSTQEQAIEENKVDTVDQSLVQENVPQEQGVSGNTAAENTTNAVDAAVAAVEDIAASMSSAPASSDLAQQATQEQALTTKPQEDQNSDVPHDTIQRPVSQQESLNASDDKPCEPSAPSEEAVAAAAADDDGKDARSSFPDTQTRTDEEKTAVVDSVLTENTEQTPVAEESQTNGQPAGDSGALPQKAFDEVSDAAPGAAVASDVDSAASDVDVGANADVSANVDADGIATDANVDSATADVNVSTNADTNVDSAAANANADGSVADGSVADGSVAVQTTTQPANP